MKFSAVLIFAAGAFAADWNAIARAVTPVGQISDGQVQNPATPYPAGNATVPVGTATAAPSGGAGPTGGVTTTSASPSQVSTNAADSLAMPVMGAGLAGIAAMLAL